MGAIAGFNNYSENYMANEGKWSDILHQMHKTIKHRRAEGEPLITEKTAFASEDANYFNIGIMFDGEIYNKKELIKSLKYFEPETNAEVALSMYMERGCNFVNDINGVFAFVIWDENKKMIYMFRDRFGVKPLFYTFVGETLVFGSEIKTLFEYPGVKREITSDGLCEIFGLGPARTAGTGVFEGIHEVLPGHFALRGEKGIKQVSYWDFISMEHVESYEETILKVSSLLKDSISRQLSSESPICAFLSGGVDSGIITAYAANELKRQGRVLDTFSFDYTGNERHFKSNAFQPDRDRPWVDKTVDMFKTNHHYLECSADTLADMLYEAVDAKDLPGMADVDSSLLYFCREVSKSNGVALSGECSDEFFGGYPWFHKKELMEKNSFPWSYDLDIRKKMLSGDLLSKISIDKYVSEKYADTLKNLQPLPSEDASEARRREISYLTVKWFMSTLLDRMDRCSQYSGIHARVPFADHRLSEYVFNIPWSFKCKDGIPKQLLREAFNGLLPGELLYRKKSPYPKIYNPAYENILKERLNEVIENKNSPILQLINPNAVKSFMETEMDYGKPWYGQLMAGPQMLAYLLQVNYWLGCYKIKIKTI